MEIKFTQYLMPDGEQRQITIDRPDEIAEKANQIIKDGYRLEAEMLLTGVISLTIFNPKTEEDEAIELTQNGPDVLNAVDKLILDFNERSIRK